MPTGEEDRPGALLAGRYRLERIVGRGASAAVWEATHVVTSQTVALKVFGGEAGLAGDGKRRDRLLREARAASRSRHPHVLAIDDLLDLEDGRAALVMPLLVGQSLRDRLAQDGKLSAETVRALFAPAVEGLARAHEAGIVHRDLKPDNLFVTAEPTRLVILDFGVAKIAADGDLGLTSTGVTVGTPFYMAPEQLFGEDDVDARADVWALGVVLFECLRGERPTEASNLGQLLKRVSGGKIGRLSAEDVPDEPGLVAIVNAMLSIEREARPTLTEIRAALAAPIEASAPPPSASPSSRSSEVEASRPEPVPAAPRTQTQTRTRTWIAGVLVALASSVLIARGLAPTAPEPPRGLFPSASSASLVMPAPPGASSLAVFVSPDPSSSTRAPSTPGPTATRIATPGTTPPTVVASSSAKIVAAATTSAVSSTPTPPRIVEQAPFLTMPARPAFFAFFAVPASSPRFVARVARAVRLPLLAFLALSLASAAGCGDPSGGGAREGRARLFIDTDLPTPEIASRLRIDLYRPDGTWFDSREVDTELASTFPASFDLAAPETGAREILVRLRVFPRGATRAYRGERYVPYAEVFGPPPEPTDEAPRLTFAGEDRTPELEPLPSLTVDRLVSLRAQADERRELTVVLHGACVGVMANLATGESCVGETRARSPLAPPSDAAGPSHTGDLREPCDGIDAGPDKICVPGGVFVLGDRRAPFIDDGEGFFFDMRTERVVRVQRFLVDRAEITVARYRKAAKAGFKSTRYQPQDNPSALGEDPLSSTSCTYTVAAGDREAHPLNCLPWGTFREYCAFEGGDLPSEAQWEYAASLAGAETERPYPWGDPEPTCDRAVYARAAQIQPDNCGLHPALPVAEIAKGDVSPLGIRDLGGSLSEFVIDGPADYADEAWVAQPFEQPLVPNARKPQDKANEDDRYMFRGGSWASPANTLRTTFRAQGSAASPFYGARCAYPVVP